jgi:sugar/nucleoside kinase (ribokinase family)
METLPVIRYIIAGQLRREYIISPRGRASIDIPGGNVLYTASGLSVWDSGIGVIAKVGSNYPAEFFEKINKRGLDTRGVFVDSQELDLRLFYGYKDNESKADNASPVSYFANLGMEYPRSLLGYSAPATDKQISKQTTPATISLSNVPSDYWEASAIHICPLDFQSHQFVMSTARQSHFNHITIDLSNALMSPAFWDDVPGMISSASALLTTEGKLSNLFQGRSKDIWEMAEGLASRECPILVIKRGMQGQYLYDYTAKTRWSIPAYPSYTADPTGAGDAYNGGFLAGLRNSYTPLEAALQGNISSSLSVEGSGPFYAMDALPGLNQARLENLRGMVHKI